jgi:hypothetical protein
MLLKDGVKYLLHKYKNEQELEKQFSQHYSEIFGSKSLFFPVKRSIRSRTGQKSIPDGYLIDFHNRRFYFIEIELASHPEYDHISKQIGKFIRAVKTSSTREKIASVMTRYVKQDNLREAFVRAHIDMSDIFQYFFVEILSKVRDQDYETVIIIDKETGEIKEACSVLTPRPKIVTFKTYNREDVGLDVHIHQFETLDTGDKPKKKVGRKRAKVQSLPQSAYRLPILHILIEEKGKGRTKDILNRVFDLMKGDLRKDDLKTSKSQREPRWRNRARWEKQNMVKDGLLKAASPTGIWEITKKGREYYRLASNERRQKSLDDIM